MNAIETRGGIAKETGIGRGKETGVGIIGGIMIERKTGGATTIGSRRINPTEGQNRRRSRLENEIINGSVRLVHIHLIHGITLYH
jgi:hypothetical protein